MRRDESAHLRQLRHILWCRVCGTSELVPPRQCKTSCCQTCEAFSIILGACKLKQPYNTSRIDELHGHATPVATLTQGYKAFRAHEGNPNGDEEHDNL